MDIQILRIKGEPYMVIGDKDPNANPMTLGEWSLMVGDRIRYEELQTDLSAAEVLEILRGNYFLVVDGEAKGRLKS